jgi:hypothetical protein
MGRHETDVMALGCSDSGGPCTPRRRGGSGPRTGEGGADASFGVDVTDRRGRGVSRPGVNSEVRKGERKWGSAAVGRRHVGPASTVPGGMVQSRFKTASKLFKWFK